MSKTIAPAKKDSVSVKAASVETFKRRFSDRELETFLDSIGKLAPEVLSASVTQKTDSIFNSRISISRYIPKNDLLKLKLAFKKGKIGYRTAASIFGKENLKGYDPTQNVPFEYHELGKPGVFAIALNCMTSWSCDVYFFSKGKLISKHLINHRYGLELEHFTDTDGNVVIYYKENFQSGSGIWWFNYFFYKFVEDELVPVLNELENGNLQFPWSIRAFWLESKVEKTNPLTIKMVYNQAFSDSIISPKFVDDSTSITYSWNPENKRFSGDYAASKISKPQILSYYIENNELLFIKAHYDLLKSNLKNDKLRLATLLYLDQVKSVIENQTVR